MAKKSMKEAATAGTSVFDMIAKGNATDVQNAKDTTDTKNAKDTKDTKAAKNAKNTKSAKAVKNVRNAKNVKDAPKLERLNLKIPADIKEYLTVAAAKASIEKKRNISLTQYLCDIVNADREKKEGAQ